MTGTSPAMTASVTLWLRERADDAGRLLHLAVERLDGFVAGESRLERIRLERGSHQGEGVVMQRPGRRAWAEVVRQSHQTLAADELVGLFAGLALGEASHGR